MRNQNNINKVNNYRGWEYAQRGDYHRHLDPNWSYAPTYLAKMKAVNEFMKSLPLSSAIVDVACGEGVLVEEFGNQGYNIKGIDLNYESDFVLRGDVRDLPYDDHTFDVVLFLDALEHLAYEDQPKALSEIYRVLKPKGTLFLSVPNLAHLNSRFQFFLKGILDRPDSEINHIGERPLCEYINLLVQHKFNISKTTGITLTVPFVYRRIICRNPAKYRWLHDLFEPIAKMVPFLSMLNNLICSK